MQTQLEGVSSLITSETEKTQHHSLNGRHELVWTHQCWEDFLVHFDSVKDTVLSPAHSHSRGDDWQTGRGFRWGQGGLPDLGGSSPAPSRSGTRTLVWCSVWRVWRTRCGTFSSCAGLQRLHWRLAVGDPQSEQLELVQPAACVEKHLV